MEIVKIAQPDKKILEEAFDAVLGRPADSQVLYAKSKIFRQYALDRFTTMYIAKEKGSVAGIAFSTFLKWDSDIFGFKIGRISDISGKLEGAAKQHFLDYIIADCAKEQYAHLNCRIGLNDFETLRLLEGLGFGVVDIQITLKAVAQTVGAAAPTLEKFLIRQASADDLGRLEGIANGAFTNTRFVADPRYPKQGVDKLYYEWVNNAVQDPAKSVFVIENRREGDLAGFSICDFDHDSEQALGKRIGSIDLITVAGGYRNQGLGQMLVRFVLDWFSKKVDEVEVRTQVSNIAALNAFIKGGFREFTQGTMLPAGISLHWWQNE